MADFDLSRQRQWDEVHKNLREHLANLDNFQTVADIFKQLGDTSRLRIFWLLCHREECVIDLADMVGMTTPAVSHHLKQLRGANLIISRREGKEVYYKANDTQTAALLHDIIEQVMDLACPQLFSPPEAAAGQELYRKEQVEIIRQIHDQLLANLDQRITIEELAKKYLLNTTTLKEVFKNVYGVSIAAHIKQHRLEKAAALLQQTDDSILQIAKAVGYESQSKFTRAFKEMFETPPSEYRKQYHAKPQIEKA